MTEIAGKVAFVTGAGSGIGRALALALGHEAATVVVQHYVDPVLAAFDDMVAFDLGRRKG